MRLRTQLATMLVAVAAVPVAVSGISGAWLIRDRLSQDTQDRLAELVAGLAGATDTLVRSSLADLRLSASALDWPRTQPEERRGALTLLWQQNSLLHVVALVDANGEGVGAPVYREQDSDPDPAGRPAVSEDHLHTFAAHIPLEAALRVGAALGPIYVPAAGMPPCVALAVAVDLRGGARGVVAAELSLQPIQARADQLSQRLGGAAGLYGPNGAAALQATGPGVVLPTHLPVQDTPTPQLRSPTWGETPMHAASAGLAGLPWTAWVATPVHVAQAPTHTLVLQTLFWTCVALLAALAAGVVLARSLTRPVHTLTQAARAYERGRLDTRVAPVPPYELSVLAAAFNHMAAQVQRRDAELRGHAETLQQKVEERTRELRQAQEQIIMGQKLAAVGELGAGVAHEINNPLAGVLGTLQLMLMRTDLDARTRAALETMETEAGRIRDIVQGLLALSPQQASAEALVDLNRVVESALGLMARPIVEARIEVRKELAPNLPPVHGRAADLQSAVMALLTNARQAMGSGGILTVRTAAPDPRAVRLSVADTGTGIPTHLRAQVFEPFFTTRAASGAKGLGLALAHRVVEDHNGQILVEEDTAQGACVVVILPAGRARTHLL